MQPGNELAREANQHLAAYDYGCYNLEDEAKWLYGDDAVAIFVSDPEILRIAAVNAEKIENYLNHHRDLQSERSHERPPALGTAREPLREYGGNAIIADLDYPLGAPPSKIIRYLADHDVHLDRLGEARLRCAHGLGVINPYEIMAVARSGESTEMDNLLKHYDSFGQRLRNRRTQARLDQWDRNAIVHLTKYARTTLEYDETTNSVATSKPYSISVAEALDDTLIREGWVGHDNIDTFLEADGAVNRPLIRSYAAAIEVVSAWEQHRSVADVPSNPNTASRPPGRVTS